jgi:hypothetical protein
MTRRNENPELSEWDMEMPRNNKFHDPLAAPLEPTTARQWLSDELDRRGIPESAKEKMLRPNDISVELLEAYAAAVSKNLQEELARLKSEVAVRDEWLRFIDAKDLKIYHELKMRAGKSPR